MAEGQRPEENDTDRGQFRGDQGFALREDIVGQVEAEAANASGGEIDPAETNIMEDPELVRIGLRTLLRRLMAHLGRGEVERAYELTFGSPPSRSLDPKTLPSLRELRERRRYTKREFARLTQSSTRALQDAESGKRVPRPGTMRKYAEVLGKHPWEIREFAEGLFGEGKGEYEQQEQRDE